jgi:diketogulonate reductase-like aldo/keto reductase
MRRVQLFDGTTLPAVGQGTWGFGADPARRASEVATLRAGLDAGLIVIDTAQYYAAGGSERVVGEAVAGRRSDAFIVTKVWPRMTSADAVRHSVMESLARMGTDYVDAVLIHWPSRGLSAHEWVAGLLALQQAGYVRYLGVSNFSTPWLEEAVQVLGARGRLAFNQLPYHPADRRVEQSLLDEDKRRGIVTMAYSPLGHRGPNGLPAAATVAAVAKARGVTPAQVVLNWVIRSGHVLAIPKTASAAHAVDNAAALEWTLSDEEIARLDEAFPAPTREFSPAVPPRTAVFRLAYWFERTAHGRAASPSAGRTAPR